MVVIINIHNKETEKHKYNNLKSNVQNYAYILDVDVKINRLQYF